MKLSVARTVRSGWQPSARELRAWAAAALGRNAGRRGGGAQPELSVLLAGPARSRRLNAQYRGRDRATNVLSFPMPPHPAQTTGLLGELVICPAVLRREARAQHKALRAHWAHMVVHGVLHLIGLDHARQADALRMERREIRILRRLGFPNPYRVPERDDG
jgi:probable rRNA maturation factor